MGSLAAAPRVLQQPFPDAARPFSDYLQKVTLNIIPSYLNMVGSSDRRMFTTYAVLSDVGQEGPTLRTVKSDIADSRTTI